MVKEIEEQLMLGKGKGVVCGNLTTRLVRRISEEGFE